MTDVGRGRHLALVDSSVPVLWVLDLQHPVLGLWLVDRLEALVSRVGVPAHGQQVDVPVPYPRDLQQHLGLKDEVTIDTLTMSWRVFPTHRFIPQVPHSTVEVGGLPQESGDILGGRLIHVRSTLGLVPTVGRGISYIATGRP